MILSFADDDTARVASRLRCRRIPADIQRTAERKLRALDSAEKLGDLRAPPGNRLEQLSGARAGTHSIRINDQWRICFRWAERGPQDVEIVDYHN